MNRKVCITGFGVLSAIGLSAQENLQALLSNQHGIGVLKNVPSVFNGELLVGEIKKSNSELKDLLDPKNINTNSRGVLMALLAIKEALSQANISKKDLKNTALISGTSVGGMDLFEQGYQGVLDKNIHHPRYYFSEHDCGNLNTKIATELGLQGFISTISTACSSSANAIMLGARLLKNKLADRVIVGGSDALSKFTINGFNTLGILDREHTKPFDKNRQGLNLGEGAGYLVLEAEDVCHGKKIYGYISGYGNANDAFHQTASSDEGIGSKLSINKALEVAGLKPTHIDYINTHGTGTPNNDYSESAAMISVFGQNNIPLFNSLKPFTGHTLAACGSIELIYSIFSMQENIVFPSLNFKEEIEETALTPTTKNTAKTINHILSNSFGFGGNCTSLILSKEI